MAPIGMKSVNVVALLIAAVLISASQSAGAATIKEINSLCFYRNEKCGPPTDNILIDGTIESRDGDKFFKVLEDMNGRADTVILRSPGGSVGEALKIGRIVRRLLLETDAPDLYRLEKVSQCLEVDSFPQRAASCVCASACFLIYAAGVPRNVAFVYLHRPFVDPAVNGELELDDSIEAAAAIRGETAKYLKEMEVPDHFVNTMLSTPSDRVIVPSYEAMRDEIAGYPQALDEWLMAKCKTLSFAQNEAAEDEMIERHDRNGLEEFRNQNRVRYRCILDALSPKREEAFSTWLLEHRNRK